LFGLGILKGTVIGLAGGLIIGLTLKETCKLINSNKKNSYNSVDNYNNPDDKEEK